MNREKQTESNRMLCTLIKIAFVITVAACHWSVESGMGL